MIIVSAMNSICTMIPLKIIRHFIEYRKREKFGSTVSFRHLFKAKYQVSYITYLGKESY